MSQTVGLLDLFRNRKYATQRFGGMIRTLWYVKKAGKKRQEIYPSLVEKSVERFANNTLIQYQSRRLTYNEFNQAANRVAHYLINQGIGKGSVVALFMANRPEFLIYQLAITKTGAAAALINNSQKGQVLLHSLKLVNRKALIIGDEYLLAIDTVENDIKGAVDVYRVPDTDTHIDPGDDQGPYTNITLASVQCSVANPDASHAPKPEDTAWYVYTSGTTGLPKASKQTHERMGKAFVMMSEFVNPLKENDVLYSTLPLYHVTALLSS